MKPFVAGYVHTLTRRFEPAVEELHEAIACNPSFMPAHTVLALAYCYAGRPEECLAELAVTGRLNPRDRDQNAIILSITGLHHLMAKRFAEAVEFQRRAVRGWLPMAIEHRFLTDNNGLVHDNP
jgi:hypothetical protein